MANHRDLTTLGLVYCVGSAIGYTAYNTCSRMLVGTYPPPWINCVQASIPALIAATFLVWQAVRGQRVVPPWKEALALVLLGILVAFGNVLYFLAMKQVGMAVVGTLQMGVILAASAILGLLILRERVSLVKWLAIGAITVSVAMFSMGPPSKKPAAGDTPSDPIASEQTTVTAENAAGPHTNPISQDDSVDLRHRLLGIGLCLLSATIMAALSVGVRKTVTGATSALAVVFLINAMSVVICGPWCVFHSDLETIVNTPWSDFKVMLLTGAVNFAAFFLLTKGLQMLPVVSVNVIVNGVTPALTAAVGILWFVEAYNIFTMLGFVFSIGGTLLISLMAPTQEQSAAPAEQTGDVAASR